VAHIVLPDDLIDKLRPLYENDWEKEQREEKKKMLSANEVMMRVATQAYEQHKKKRPL
jgi:roadblock/LC7 domain-containing protein